MSLAQGNVYKTREKDKYLTIVHTLPAKTNKYILSFLPLLTRQNRFLGNEMRAMVWKMMGYIRNGWIDPSNACKAFHGEAQWLQLDRPVAGTWV